MNQIRTITIIDWTLDEPSTGFEYKLKYSPEEGVTEILSVHAIQDGCPSIDITFNLVHRYNLDQIIEEVLSKEKLDEAYRVATQERSPFFSIASGAMKYAANNF